MQCLFCFYRRQLHCVSIALTFNLISKSELWCNPDINGEIVVSIFTLFSESGDWANYVYYYFRQEGTLAKIQLEYRTFHGNFAAIKDAYFDSKGEVLERKVKYLDLDNKPKKPDKDYLIENSPLMNDFGYYKTINKLPFYHLLKSKN